jgi:hypothetical protein
MLRSCDTHLFGCHNEGHARDSSPSNGDVTGFKICLGTDEFKLKLERRIQAAAMGCSLDTFLAICRHRSPWFASLIRRIFVLNTNHTSEADGLKQTLKDFLYSEAHFGKVYMELWSSLVKCL